MATNLTGRPSLPPQPSRAHNLPAPFLFRPPPPLILLALASAKGYPHCNELRTLELCTSARLTLRAFITRGACAPAFCTWPSPLSPRGEEEEEEDKSARAGISLSTGQISIQLDRRGILVTMCIVGWRWFFVVSKRDSEVD